MRLLSKNILHTKVMKNFFKKPQMKKVLATLYRPFKITNVSGNLSPISGWTTSLANPPEISTDEIGKSVIRSTGQGPIYLVAQGNEREFRALSPQSGFPTEGKMSIRISAKLTGEGNARASIVILEFDDKRTRIGELVVGPVARVRGALLPDTKFVLPTIRIAGEGTIRVERLEMELSESRVSTHNKADRLAILQESEMISDDPNFVTIQAELAKLKEGISRLDSEISEYHSTNGNLDRPVRAAALDSRNDGKISSAREAFAREFLTEMANSLPSPLASHHFSKIPAKIGIITDEYMFNFYKDVFEQVLYLSPDNYQSVLEETSLDAIFYVTCWKGMKGEEWKGIKFRDKPMKALDEILQFAKKNQIRTVFQSIEDPSNFEYFLPVAKNFDWVFTSDSDMVPEYKAQLGHENVFYGEYGANPTVNNPVGSFRYNINKVFFAGSYPERYPDRCADMKLVFSSIPDSDRNLVILDRNFQQEGFDFPLSVQASVLGPVPHATLQKMHKLFRMSLNFNSIKSSPTMCAMRVYELQAQGKPIISNYARSVFNRFPGIRIIAHDTTLNEVISPNEHFEELEVANKLMTRLFSEKSSFHVVSAMTEKIGLPVAPARSDLILVVAIGDLEAVKTKVSAQSGVTATVVTQDDFVSADYEIEAFGYITAMDEKQEYEREYLRSRLNVFIYTDVLFATQLAHFDNSNFIDGPIHEFTGSALKRCLTVASTKADGIKEFFSGQSEKLTGSGYAADPFGVGYSKYLADQLRSQLATVPKLSVIVPVFNNGAFLETKCIPSLRRNKLWPEMEILLIDDGSTEELTIRKCHELTQRYENIKLFSFNDGGSGSASRPRNKGVDLASSDLITYLDPDNEISSGGYDNLYDEFIRLNLGGTETDLVSGYQVKVAETTKFTGRHTAGEVRTVRSASTEFFNKGKFPVVSTQAAIIRKSMLQENNIEFVEKAAGQDTLYGWQVLAYAKNPTFIDTAYILYFAERSDSVTNQVDPEYFQKCLELERVQVLALKKLGFFEIYRDSQFDNFMRNWYFEKLRKVNPSEQAQALSSLQEIAGLYGAKISDYTI